MFALKQGAPERVAEFRWSTATGVVLNVFDTGWGEIARQYFEQGVPDDAEMRLIPRSDGRAFMKALATLDRGSYCSFVVEDS